MSRAKISGITILVVAWWKPLRAVVVCKSSCAKVREAHTYQRYNFMARCHPLFTAMILSIQKVCSLKLSSFYHATKKTLFVLPNTTTTPFHPIFTSHRVHHIFALFCPISLPTTMLHVGQFILPRAREIASRCHQIQATASHSILPQTYT